MNYTVIDFETANQYRSSACALGLIRVENDQEVFRKSWLIRPEPFEFSPYNVAVHGLTEADCETAPTFADVYAEIRPYIEDQLLVAHNASFDVSVLRRSLEIYNIPVPNFTFLCTWRMAQASLVNLASHRLDMLCAYYNIPLNHHDALSDTNACLEVFRILKGGIDSVHDLCATLHICEGSYTSHDYSSCSVSCPRSIRPRTGTATLSPHADDDFLGKNFVFTGTLLSMTRVQASAIVTAGGGCVQNGITEKTNVLVAGLQDIARLNGQAESSKMRKAKALRATGADIQIIGEDEFVSLLDEELLCAPRSEARNQKETISGDGDEPLTDLEEKAVQIINSILADAGMDPSDVHTERRAGSYLTLVCGENRDFCRVKMGSRSVWFSLDLWHHTSAIKDDPRLANVNNKNQRHWKIPLCVVDDLREYSDFIVLAYKTSLNV